MKLEDIKVPEGYEVKGFNYPCAGDYVLLPSGEPFEVSKDDYTYHCGGIILEKVWEPEIGKYYEFSGYADFPTPIIRKYVGNPSENEKYKYEDEIGESWRYIRPVQEELLGK